jgi:hypothetical protein
MAFALKRRRFWWSIILSYVEELEVDYINGCIIKLNFIYIYINI